jgi:adenylate cyclase
MRGAGTGHRPRGGEILKFVGDAMLAIFSCESTREAKCAAADTAITAAEEALARIESLNLERQDRGAVPLRAGVAIGVGKVMYGNIGTADRLDFTVMPVPPGAASASSGASPSRASPRSRWP